MSNDICSVCWRKATGDFPDPEDDEAHDEEMEHCLDLKCHCKCHDDFLESCGLRFEGSVIWDMDELYERKGIFPFLSLPLELRERIYEYAFLQKGMTRYSMYHRGAIHTALIRTCRQVYSEAGSLPLKYNTPCFNNYAGILNFVGFCLTPKTRDLVTRVHLEIDMDDIHNPSYKQSLARLQLLPITNLEITLRGGYTYDSIKDHTCVINAFSDFDQLQSVDPNFVSGKVNEQEKKDLAEKFQAVILGKKGTLKTKRSTKRLTKGNATAPKLVKRAKKLASKVSQHQNPCMISANIPKAAEIIDFAKAYLLTRSDAVRVRPCKGLCLQLGGSGSFVSSNSSGAGSCIGTERQWIKISRLDFEHFRNTESAVRKNLVCPPCPVGCTLVPNALRTSWETAA